MSDAPADSPLKSLEATLAKRRSEIACELFLDLEVPNWTDPTITVRYQVVQHDVIKKAQRTVERADRVNKSSQGEVELNANKDLLIKACVGITATDPNDAWTGFGDDALGVALGVTERSARAVCGELFLSEGAIFSHAAAVIEFCGYKNAEIDKDLAGE